MPDNPLVIPLVALRGLTVFPQMRIHFDVSREKSARALEEAVLHGQTIFLTAQTDIASNDPQPSELYSIGTISRICQILRLPGDNVRVLVEGEQRGRILHYTQTEPYYLAGIERIEDKRHRVSATRQEALVRCVREAFSAYTNLTPRVSPELVMNVLAIENPGHLADYIAQNISLRHEEKQMVLEEMHPVRRLEFVLQLLSRESEILEIEQSIQNKLQGKLGRNQRDYYLREQIKVIQSELGEEEDVQSEAEGYRERIRALQLSEEAEKKLLREAGRLSHMTATSPEAGVIRNYLDICLDLPWNETTRDRVDVARAEKILESDHFGLKKVKERLLEFLAVKQLAPDLKGQILCLVGPPGVGKTSIAMSFARALNRKLARLSLGGVRDEADIRGHRKTYIGAMPGRIMTAVRQAGSRNPVLLLDEVDKMGHDFRGDPSAALLELLDPEQNNAFRDHYIELPFDLSDVLFVTTANSLETIPRPLLDRMEIIELTSYTDEEKLQIAKRHLLPKQMTKHGLGKTQLLVRDDAIRALIMGYTRESGVRRLERMLAAVCRKSARRIASGERKKVNVNSAVLEELLGPRKYKPESLRGQDEAGVVNGLAWTQVGGVLLTVESAFTSGSGKIELTGNLGDVMKESARAALTYIRTRADALKLDKDFYKNRDLHVHFPEGATPKDGPSAGIAMCVAMISALSGAPARRDVAMTGEISLRGRVLPIGGLKEKTMAAYRYGIQTVIIPADNEKDLEDIDPTVRAALTFIPVEHIDAVLSAAIDWSRRPEQPEKREDAVAQKPVSTLPTTAVPEVSPILQ